MRILSIHNEYQIRGGEDESCAAEVSLLRKMGHEVERYLEHNDDVVQYSKLNLATKTIWSQESYRIVCQQLKSSKYDLVHVQNFFPLISPSVYYAARHHNVPVIQTLRNYRLICPNALFFREGKVCEDCLGKSIPYPGIVHGCYRGNRFASGGVAAMLTFHRSIQTWQRMVDRYICLTEFARQKMIAGGLVADKIIVKPNFITDDFVVQHSSLEDNQERVFAIYVGRLSVEKGIDTLLSAWETLDKPIPLKIVGDGPLKDQVDAVSRKLTHVEALGRLPMAEVHQLIGKAMFLVFPSKWYETFGRVAVEAFVHGTPVVAAKIGAIAELVDDHHTGLHFKPGDAQDLAAKVEWLVAHPEERAMMGKAGRAEFEAKYTAKANYQKLMDIYKLVVR